MPVDRSATSVAIFSPAEEAPGGPMTVSIFGVARGGTSMIAGAVRGLGIHLGDNLQVNNEDLDFSYKTPEHMKAAIKDRNSKYKEWGWKFPAAANYLNALMPELRNPYLIIACRDVAATCTAHVQWHSREAEAAITDIMGQLQKNIRLAYQWKRPTLLVSYEKASIRPEKFLEELCEFLRKDIVVDRDDLIAYMKPGTYKPFEQLVGTTKPFGGTPSASPSGGGGARPNPAPPST